MKFTFSPLPLLATLIMGTCLLTVSRSFAESHHLADAEVEKHAVTAHAIDKNFGEKSSSMPEPGSYKLEHIMQAPDGEVLDSDGKKHQLSRFTKGKMTVLSFIFTRCHDAKGCPYAYAVFQQLQHLLDDTPKLKKEVRLVSLSFDPVNDTPKVMKTYSTEALDRDSEVPWSFLTTEHPRQLLPLLDGFGQDVSVVARLHPGEIHDHDSELHQAEFSHVLKVFLIDPENSIREIYTTSFLQPQTILNDIQTLKMEREKNSSN